MGGGNEKPYHDCDCSVPVTVVLSATGDAA